MLGRRRFLRLAAGAAAAISTACRSSSTSDGQRRLRVMLNGGIYEELARRFVIDPFEKETGATVDVVPASSAQIVTRLMAERAAPSVDVVIIDQLVMGKAIEEGLFERVDPANVPHMRDLAPEAIDPRGFGPIVHSHNLVLGYNTKLLKVAPPTSWRDLWDPRFRGMVVPGAIALTPGLLFLLEANALNGGTYDNLDPGFAALARLKPNVRRYFQSIGEVRPLVSQDNVIVAISSNMLQVEIANGSPVAMVFPTEGCLASPAVAQIVRGTPAKAVAEAFINRYLDPDVQLGWARDYNVSVFNTKAAVSAELEARIADKVVFFDAAEVSRRRDAWVERWMREIRG